MDIIDEGIKVHGTAADLARATKYTPQAISVAKKRGAVSDAMTRRIRRANELQLRRAQRANSNA